MNHGCNGSYNVGSDLSKLDQVITEQNAQPSDERTFRKETYDWEKYNPYKLRHIHHISSSYEIALRNIQAGEELLTDYLEFQEGQDWWPEVQELKQLCNGEIVGFITKKESSDSNTHEAE